MSSSETASISLSSSTSPTQSPSPSSTVSVSRSATNSASPSPLETEVRIQALLRLAGLTLQAFQKTEVQDSFKRSVGRSANAAPERVFITSFRTSSKKQSSQLDVSFYVVAEDMSSANSAVSVLDQSLKDGSFDNSFSSALSETSVAQEVTFTGSALVGSLDVVVVVVSFSPSISTSPSPSTSISATMSASTSVSATWVTEQHDSGFSDAAQGGAAAGVIAGCFGLATLGYVWRNHQLKKSTKSANRTKIVPLDTGDDDEISPRAMPVPTGDEVVSTKLSRDDVEKAMGRQSQE